MVGYGRVQPRIQDPMGYQPEGLAPAFFAGLIRNWLLASVFSKLCHREGGNGIGRRIPADSIRSRQCVYVMTKPPEGAFLGGAT